MVGSVKVAQALSRRGKIATNMQHPEGTLNAVQRLLGLLHQGVRSWGEGVAASNQKDLSQETGTRALKGIRLAATDGANFGVSE